MIDYSLEDFMYDRVKCPNGCKKNENEDLFDCGDTEAYFKCATCEMAKDVYVVNFLYSQIHLIREGVIDKNSLGRPKTAG